MKSQVEENQIFREEVEIGDRKLIIETGRLAKLAHGAVTVRLGDTVVLVTAVSSKEKREDIDFFPLLVEYRERSYASGKIPGGFFKREGRPSTKEILSARIIDRTIRPLFPEFYANDTMVHTTVLSADDENEADVLGVIGASAALTISDIPFDGPIGSVRIGKIGDSVIINPTYSQQGESVADIVVSGSEDSIIMVEGECKEIPEDLMIELLEKAHEEIKKTIEIQKKLQEKTGKEKREFEIPEFNKEIKKIVDEKCTPVLNDHIRTADKKERELKIGEYYKEFAESLQEEFPESEKEIKYLFKEKEKELVRDLILNKEIRVDGRKSDEIRPITCEVGVLPRTHGSALFTRGQTQSLASITLGTKIDEQKIEGLDGATWKRYMLHYNFPGFCVGEVKPERGPGRREIGHGFLAERSVEPVIPTEEQFPYTIRIVSDILESNGSSSMASVCAGSLSLMDAGVPIKNAVSGIAMGLIIEGGKVAILSDILGMEDHLGDMDFKVAGTKDGITACQMDIKIKGISFDIMKKALMQAKEGRQYILDIMGKAISEPRSSLSEYAPIIIRFTIKPDEIGLVIGPGGKMIREIQEKTNTDISIEQEGDVFIAAKDADEGQKAKEMIMNIVTVPEIGTVYTATVKKITNFGAFVEFLPGKEGLVHISELEHRRVNKVEDVLKLGDQVQVKIIKIDPNGKIDLSRKALLKRNYDA
ncbi:polyribonucleotide nucleotidyltransferase [candidate division KSB1 bacterium]